MKVIVPLAGKGTRLLPLTKRVPKPLVRVAGRPVMDYVMDAVKGLDIEELIVITGHLKESVERYILEHYDVPAKFVEQKKLDGTAGAINLARPYVDSPVLIIFVDTVFEADQQLAEHGRARAPSGPCPRCTIVPPVYIEEGVTIHDATIGPNVSIEAGSFVAESTIANSILGRNVRVVRGTVKDSLVGDDQKIEGKVIQQSVMDAGEVAPAK